jgi:hypothetical protein
MADRHHLQVEGQWDAIQDNHFVAHFDIKLTGAVHSSGGLEIEGGTRCSHSGGRVKSLGAVGHVLRDFFDFTVTWDNDSEGHYHGLVRRVAPEIGLIKGDTEDNFHPGSQSGWHSSRRFSLPILLDV